MVDDAVTGRGEEIQNGAILQVHNDGMLGCPMAKGLSTKMKRTAIRRKSPRRRLAQKIDLRVREMVLERDGYACLWCGATKLLHAAHILPKGKYPRLRFEPENILTLCVGCHLIKAHKDPLAFAAWLHRERPGLYDRLLVLAAVARKVDLTELAIYYGVK